MSINSNSVDSTGLESCVVFHFSESQAANASFPPTGKHKRPRERSDQRVSLLRFMKPFDRSRVDTWADIYAVQLYTICP